LAQTDHRFLNLMAAIEDEGGCQNPSKRLKQTSEIATKLTSLNQSSCDFLTGLEADKEIFLKNVAPKLSNYRSVVFATHGYVGNQIPGIMEPVLALTMVPPGKDGYLTMTEVSGLQMNADLAALVACQTGVGAKMAGEGVMSMGRAFQCAGARSVLMTLWSVDETASVKLMQSFFEKLHQGMTKSDAWSTARSELRKSGYDDPFYWAAFIMVGETN
jgi:CHAT domain-containing protein